MTADNIRHKQIISHNEAVWNKLVEKQCEWSKPVSTDIIEKAKMGKWSIHITKKPLPSNWLPKDIKSKNILCLASAGGQQAPVLAAAGAEVTVLDISKKQLEQDQLVAKRDGLRLTTIQGDMSHLDKLSDEAFDYIIHPISNLYISSLDQLWQKCYRVLKKDGTLLASFYNPILFVFERNLELEEEGLLKPKYTVPYSDLISLEQQTVQAKIKNGEALVFGHTLSEQIAGQIAAGFSITGLYEDDHPSPRFLIEKFMQTMIATKAQKF